MTACGQGLDSLRSVPFLRGVWIFEVATVAGSGQDLRNGGQVEQSVQAIGGVAIVMEHPTGSRTVENMIRTPGG
jgi:hypothetical protein